MELWSARIRRKSLTEPVEISVGLRVIQDGKLLVGLRGRLLAHLNVILWGE